MEWLEEIGVGILWFPKYSIQYVMYSKWVSFGTFYDSRFSELLSVNGLGRDPVTYLLMYLFTI